VPAKKSLATSKLPVPVALIERRIYLIGGHKVMIDTELAQFSRRFHVSTEQTGSRVFDIAICDLKEGPGWTPHLAY
jgi:hypothetical protein